MQTYGLINMLKLFIMNKLYDVNNYKLFNLLLSPVCTKKNKFLCIALV